MRIALCLQMGRRAVSPLVVATTLLVCLPAPEAMAQSGVARNSLSPELLHAKEVLSKYRDPVMAIHDGYMSLLGCIEYPSGSAEGSMQYVPGGMGVHFLNPANVGPTLDPAKPQVLIYEPVGDKLSLVAAEWFMPMQIAGDKAPVIFGKSLEGPMEGHKPLMPTELHHYDLHVWLWKNNPAGVFSPTNPAIKCQKGPYSFAEAAPNMVKHGKH
ncbi:MAG: hypothetical protein ABIZ91_00205 [Gemmatimonadaceae bacterium]